MTRRSPLFLDLDGPLLDVRARYHGVYAAIAAELDVPALDLDQYWAAKRRRAPLRCFFPAVGNEEGLRKRYLERWLGWIEAPEWLAHDTLVRGADECLERVGRSHELYLVTLRRRPAALARQLDVLGLRPYFRQVFSGWTQEGSDGGAGEAARLKARWMRPLVSDGNGVIVGDTEVDMQAGALLGMRTIGVSFGIRQARELVELGAEAIIGSLMELPGLLVAPLVRTGNRA
jgi:phosphoglycolate phosphatase-like HAD superfamily hydrolase